MSSHSEKVAEHVPGHPVQFEEHLPSGAIVAVLLAALVTFAIGITWAYTILVRGTKAGTPDGAPAVPKEIGQSEIGIVDQTLFEAGSVAEAHRAAKVERLSNWGWVDRSAGLIHMPLDKAAARYLESQKRAGGQGQQQQNGGQP